MQQLPHEYGVNATANTEGNIQLSAENLPTLESAPPAQFGGPGDQWSPEDLLVGSIANCFILTFKAIARASKLEWTSLACSANGTLDRVERSMQFTGFSIAAELTLPDDSATDKARMLLEKAEQNCLVTNSLKADCHLEITIR